MDTYTGPTMSTTATDLLIMPLNDSSAPPIEGAQPEVGTYCEYIPGLVSQESSRRLNALSMNYASVHGYIAIVVCLFGILCNSANVIVLTRKNMQSSVNILLTWLAVSDLLKMTCYLPFAIHFYVMNSGHPDFGQFSTSEYSWICFLLFYASFAVVCHTVGAWLTIAMAIFRYIYICLPTRGAFYCSQKRAKGVVILVICLTIIVLVPNMSVNTFSYTVPQNTKNISSSENNTGIQATVPKGYYHPMYRDNQRLQKTNYWIHAIVLKLIPCFMLTTLTLLLVHAMHRAYRKRMKLKSQGRKAESDRNSEHNRTTRMLLAVVVLFTFTELPNGIMALMNIFITCFSPVVYEKLGDLLDIIALTNNAINFVLYCTMSTQFRNTFVEIFCPAKARQNTPKWFKLGILKGRNKNSIEVSEGARAAGQRSKNNNTNPSAQTENGSSPIEKKSNGQSPDVSHKINNEATNLNSVPLETNFPSALKNEYDGGAQFEDNDSEREPLASNIV